MREIKFRGKYSEKGKWIFGHYYNNHDNGSNQSSIINEDDDYIVQDFYVCQFTGFKDKNGNEIYEGDVLGDWSNVDGKMIQSKLQVFFDDSKGCWMLDYSFHQDKSDGLMLYKELQDFDYEIVGNIFEK